MKILNQIKDALQEAVFSSGANKYIYKMQKSQIW